MHGHSVIGWQQLDALIGIARRQTRCVRPQRHRAPRSAGIDHTQLQPAALLEPWLTTQAHSLRDIGIAKDHSNPDRTRMTHFGGGKVQ